MRPDIVLCGEEMNEQDRRRRRALIVFQVVIYAALIAMFLIQVQMYIAKGW